MSDGLVALLGKIPTNHENKKALETIHRLYLHAQIEYAVTNGLGYRSKEEVLQSMEYSLENEFFSVYHKLMDYRVQVKKEALDETKELYYKLKENIISIEQGLSLLRAINQTDVLNLVN